MPGTRVMLWLIALPIALQGASVEAQGYPAKPVRFLVGFTPGGEWTSTRACSRPSSPSSSPSR